MIQTLAIFVDAYRELNARRLFWVTLILTLLFISAFALIGYDASGLTLLGHRFEFPFTPTNFYRYFYKAVFSRVVIDFWLAWAAIILALISTAGIFPDLMTGGSIELYLARPMSRLRLFLTKYLTGLLFVGVQVVLISVGGFVVMGVRGKLWIPSILLAIPVVMLLFSYLYSICVLIGVWSRSTLTALLITLLAWALCFGVFLFEQGILTWQRVDERRVEQARQRIALADADLQSYAAHPTHDLLGLRAGLARKQKEISQDALPALEADAHLPRMLHDISYGVRAVIFKTTETTKLLDRWLLSDDEAMLGDQRQRDRAEAHGHGGQAEKMDAAMDVEETDRHRSMTWIIGSSLIDELALIALAAWMFCRRDY